MHDPLHRLLWRAEIEDAAPVTVQEARRWGPGAAEQFAALGMLRATTPGQSIHYDGCDHGCSMTPHIITIPATGEQIGVHGCAYDCGLVRIPLSELRRWEVDLLGVARQVARAIDAGGKVVEDIPGRLVEVGRIVEGDAWRDVFLARGLAWSDAASALAGARRLTASAAPLVLAMSDLPDPAVWPGCRPAVAALVDIASLDGASFTVDLTGVSQRPTKPHAGATGGEWVTVTEAANRLVAAEVLDDLKLSRAKSLISTAATRGHLVANGEKGGARRIESGSLAEWMLKQRDKNLAEDIDAPRPMRGPVPNHRPRQPLR